jgi:heat shock protein HtpX
LPKVPWRDTIETMHNAAKTALLLGLLSAVLLALGELLGGSNGLMIAFVFAVVMNFASYWFSDRIVLAMYGAKEVGPEHPFFQLVSSLAQRANLPQPRVYIIPADSPNAFATGRNPHHAAVAATEGILRMLNQRELEGVIAHELTHVRNRDILISSVAATIAAAIMMVARMAQFAALFGGGYGGRDGDREGSNPLALLLTILVAPLAAILIQAAISRSREYAADEGGAAIAGSPYGLVDALKKIDDAAKRIPLDANPATSHMFIVQPFSGRNLFNLFSSHPPTDKRIQALLHLS